MFLIVFSSVLTEFYVFWWEEVAVVDNFAFVDTVPDFSIFVLPSQKKLLCYCCRFMLAIHIP